MIKVSKYDCCGCTACATVCPVHAISMEPDGLGFKYPVVNESLCIDCGLCDKTCVFSERKEYIGENIQKAYIARHKDECEILRSQSGAAFATFAKYVVENEGVVYGAAYRKDLSVVHVKATNLSQLELLRGSKYVQSDLSGIFINIKSDLQKGRVVLFSGTPCQVAGLKSYIGDKKKLLTIDIVCHGVPAPSIWKSNIREIEKEQKGQVVKADYRNKDFTGWKSRTDCYKIRKDNDVIHFSGFKFTRLFYKDITNRRSCSICPYTSFNRPGDITIGDFWGYKNVDASYGDDNIGCSMIICNTSQGKMLFESVKSEFRYLQVELKDCLQPNLQEPSCENIKRDDFERDYIDYGYEYVLKKYGEFDLISRVRNKFISVFRNRIG